MIGTLRAVWPRPQSSGAINKRLKLFFGNNPYFYKSIDMIKKAGTVFIYIFLAGWVMMLAEGCGSSKKCGCSGDLSKVYHYRKAKRRY